MWRSSTFQPIDWSQEDPLASPEYALARFLAVELIPQLLELADEHSEEAQASDHLMNLALLDENEYSEERGAYWRGRRDGFETAAYELQQLLDVLLGR